MDPRMATEHTTIRKIEPLLEFVEISLCGAEIKRAAPPKEMPPEF